MIRLESGKTYVWQWDTKRRVELTGFPVGTMVHYSNCKTVEAPVVATKKDGDKLVADIPPELMQEPYDITVYACDEDGTRHCSFISVLSRPKPESYVYEPVEVLRYETLAKRIPFDDSYEGMLLRVSGGVARPLALGDGLYLEGDALHAAGGGGGSSGPAYVASEEPPTNTKALWVDTSEPEEAVALGVTAKETAEGVDLYCTDELGTTKVSLRNGKDGAPGTQGPQGPAGPAGPQGPIGDDYVLTDDDVQEIVGAVLAALPTWTGGVY